MADPGLLGAILGQVMAESTEGTKVLFVAGSTLSDDDTASADDIAKRAQLTDESWNLFRSGRPDDLESFLSKMAKGTSGVVLMSLDGAQLVVPEIEGLEIAVVEIG